MKPTAVSAAVELSIPISEQKSHVCNHMDANSIQGEYVGSAKSDEHDRRENASLSPGSTTPRDHQHHMNVKQRVISIDDYDLAGQIAL